MAELDGYTFKGGSNSVTLTVSQARGNRESHGHGLVVWDAGKLLAEYLVGRSAELRGKLVLELGSGPGIVGLACAACGARVVLTDHDPHVLSLLHENVAANAAAVKANGGSATVMPYRWGDPSPVSEHVDFVVASDVLNKEEWVDAFVKALHVTTSKDTVIYLANTEQWNCCTEFDAAAQEMGLAVEVVPTEVEAAALGKGPIRVLRMQLWTPECTPSGCTSRGKDQDDPLMSDDDDAL